MVLEIEILPAWCYLDGMGRPGWTGTPRFTEGFQFLVIKISSFNRVNSIINLQAVLDRYEF